MGVHFLKVTALIIFISIKAFADYQPLAGSEWAKQNPGLLPYSKCAFVQSVSEDGLYKTKGLNIDAHGGALIFGTLKPDRRDWVLGCVSEEHGLAYMLPVRLSTFNFFPAIAIADQGTMGVKLKSSTLNGKTVDDLFRRFHGGGASIGVLISGGVFGYENKSGIAFRLSEVSGTIVDFRLGYSWTNFKRLDNIRVDDRFGPHQKGLFGITSSTTDVSITPVGPHSDHVNCHFPVRKIRTVDWLEIRKLKFVRDAKKS